MDKELLSYDEGDREKKRLTDMQQGFPSKFVINIFIFSYHK